MGLFSILVLFANTNSYFCCQGHLLYSAPEWFHQEIIHKHRLIELYLVKKMNCDLDEVHEIAEEVEHIKNIKFFKRIQEILGDCDIDPHGSIIPKQDY